MIDEDNYMHFYMFFFLHVQEYAFRNVGVSQPFISFVISNSFMEHVAHVQKSLKISTICDMD